jgi:flagellum-specific peptidoglycan hydrolase FlgJ
MNPQELDQQIYITALNNKFSDESARLIVAQARLESADYSSNVFKNNFNMYGMKYIGQKLAERGTIAPKTERSKKCIDTGICRNSDYYAKYKNPIDSVKDTITRLYQVNIKGITPDQLKNAKTPLEFATLLKKRGYFGVTADQYAKGLNSKLKKINIQSVQTLPGVTITDEKKKFNWIWIIIATGISYILYKKK